MSPSRLLELDVEGAGTIGCGMVVIFELDAAERAGWRSVDASVRGTR